MSYVASYPLCCPARTTWITGQYPHNHGVIDSFGRTQGGYENLREPDRVLPAWLDAAGYDTALVGKWIHNCPELVPPPGWDEWRGLVTDRDPVLRLRAGRLGRRPGRLRQR